MKKVAVFGGDIFWTSCPYEMLDVYKCLDKKVQTDAILFASDIRLNKIFEGPEKYFFSVEKYRSIENLKIIDSWESFFVLSREYDFILCSSKIFPKTRMVKIPNNVFSKMVFWDVGGADQLTDVVEMHRGIRKTVNAMTKGPAWKAYIDKYNPENTGLVTSGGTPQYDPYFYTYQGYHNVLSRDDFRKKYNITSEKIFLVAPTNPSSHREMTEKNIKNIDFLLNDIQKKNIDASVALKTYPNDYLFFEKDGAAGVYKRKFYKDNSTPQHLFFEKKYPEIKIIESQDHHSSLLNSDYLFNVGGSHISWETFFTGCESFSCSYEDQPFFGGVSYLPDFVKYPDKFMNQDMKEFDVEIAMRTKNMKSTAQTFFEKTKFSENIFPFLRTLWEKNYND